MLLQFARAPVKGRVKTRMLPYLSAAGACDLHCDLVRWTCERLLGSALGDVEVHVAGNLEHALFAECRALGAADIVPQRGDDLGERMHRALRDALLRYRTVILVGSDCPGIDAAYLQRAAFALQEAPLVVGPATDGGYVMLGARTLVSSLFRAMPWGTDRVYAQTRSALSRAGLRWAELPALADIDRPEDLPVWEALQRDTGAARAVPARVRQ
ncbi:MAG: glycosyltransferase [Halioglobus sp.]|nr:glycosyltransferase [Halioglobus sp.]